MLFGFPLTVLAEWLDNRDDSTVRKWQARYLVGGRRWGIVFVNTVGAENDEQATGKEDRT